jgi:hypothetical protein
MKSIIIINYLIYFIFVIGYSTVVSVPIYSVDNSGLIVPLSIPESHVHGGRFQAGTDIPYHTTFVRRFFGALASGFSRIGSSLGSFGAGGGRTAITAGSQSRALIPSGIGPVATRGIGPVARTGGAPVAGRVGPQGGNLALGTAGSGAAGTQASSLGTLATSAAGGLLGGTIGSLVTGQKKEEEEKENPTVVGADSNEGLSEQVVDRNPVDNNIVGLPVSQPSLNETIGEIKEEVKGFLNENLPRLSGSGNSVQETPPGSSSGNFQSEIGGGTATVPNNAN